MAARSEAGLERVKQKIEKCFQDGDLYHAHQMYRTIHFRLKRQNKLSECTPIMCEGAERLLSKGELNSGADLAKLYVELLTSGETTADLQIYENIANLHSMMKPSSPERTEFIAQSLEYSATFGDEDKKPYGHPDLHRLLALNYWKEKNFVDAKYHFTRSRDGTNCALMLVEFHQSRGYNSEVDLFIAQTVLQYLCLKDQRTATVAFYVYTQRHPLVEGPPFAHPLLNFVWFLLLAVENRAKLSIFDVLCEKYESSIKRDSTYDLYLEKIGQYFFNKSPPRRDQGSGGGLFGNIINQLMNELDDDEGPGVFSEDVD